MGVVCSVQWFRRHPETPRVSPCYLSFFGYVSPCTTPDLAAGCPIQAFVMNRRLMGEKGEEEKRKEKKIEEKKKILYRSIFWNIYSTAYKGGIFEKYKKKTREKGKGTNTRNPSNDIHIR